MKRISLSLTIVLIAYLANAQTNTFPPTGNVGIGTLTPAAWDAAYKVIDLYTYGFLFGSSNGTGYSGTGYGQTSWGNNSYYDGTSHAVGTGAASNLLQGTGYLIFENAPSVDAGATQTFTERFRITNAGNVGIGTANPLNNLQIGSQTSLQTALPVTLSLGATYSNTAGTNPKLKLYDDGVNLYGFGISSSELDAIIPTGGTYAWYIGNSKKMILSSNGNVGIGTATPDQLLTINGTIHAKEVKVDMNILPDYVFNRTYKLPSLKHIKTFIAQNHHLPEVPSAQLITKDGLNLGEMNAILLKKVEELTLYLIEKDNKERIQEEKLKRLEERLNTLSNIINNKNN